MNEPKDLSIEGTGYESIDSDLLKRVWDQCRNGDHESALVALHSALKQSPKSVPLHLELAKVYNDEQKSEKTIEYCAKALRIDPNNSLACAFMGAAYTRRRQWDKAVSFLLRALALEDGSEYAYELLGRLVLEATLSVIERFPNYHPDSEISVFGGPSVRIRDLQEGIQYYQNGCTEKWQFLRVYYRLGMLYYHADKPEALHDRILAAAKGGYGPAQEWLKERGET
jgi:tetratricopeptide (TPR) repeat protein